MRILHTADWHLGQEWMGVERDSDMQKFIMPEIVDIALREKIDLLVIAGDIFDDPGGRKASLRLCARLLREPFKELLSNGVHIALIPGNHDNRPMFRLIESALQLAPLSNRSQLFVFTQPDVVELNGVQLVGFPYLKAVHFRQMLQELPVAPDLRNQTLSVQYEQYLNQLKQQKVKGNKPAVLIGHFSVSGAKLQPDGEWAGNEVSYARDLTVSREALLTNDQVPQYNALGHIHLAQAVPECVVPTHYAGAPDIFERGQEKYDPQVLIVDLPEKGRVVIRPILLERTTPFIKETITSRAQIDSIAEKYGTEEVCQRVLGDLIIEAESTEKYETLREAAVKLFPRLYAANTVRLKFTGESAPIQFELTDEYMELVNPRKTLEHFFEQNYDDKQIPILQSALDNILQELTSAN